MIEVEFNNANFDAVKQLREGWTNKGWHPGVVTNYNDRMGKGVMLLFDLEKGLTVVMSDTVAKDDVTFINKAFAVDNNALFTLNYVAMGEVFIVKDKQGTQKHFILNKQVLHHSKSNFSFISQKGKRTRAIDIIFSHDWLMSQFPPSKEQEIKEKIATIESLQHFYIDSISINSFELVRDILDKVFYEEWDYMFLKPRIMFLIEEFARKYVLSKENEPQKMSDRASLPMVEIKEKINNALYEKIPNRKILAKEFLMSESTLDRHFKQNFGKTINEYHLSEKMELSKRILNRDEYSVSQVAYLMGYETISAFIKSFKKHFGISPGLLKKRTAPEKFESAPIIYSTERPVQ